GGKRLVSSAALRETHSPQILMSPGGGGGRGGAPNDTTTPTTRFNSYGFGWMVEDYRNQLVWQHGGNTPGMTTAVGMLPEKKSGVVVRISMQRAALPALLRQYIFDRELGAPMRDVSAEALTRSLAQRKRADSLEKVQQAGRPADVQSPVPQQAFVGTFTDSLY